MDGSDDIEQFSRIPTLEDLVTLCRNLNAHDVKYVIVGGFAVIRFGYIRATGDIDLLVENSPENIEKIRKALSYLPDGEAHKIGDTDLDQYRVVRVSGEITVDLLEDGHISIPQEIVDKLKIDRGSKLRVTVEVEKGISKDTILSYAGLLSDLTCEEEKRFDESVKRRSFY